MGSNLKDIAQELGLSVSTVSRAINNKGYVSQATKKRVQKAVEKHQYVPNQVARSLRTQATKTVGIIVPDIGEYFAAVIKGADEVFSAHGYSIILVDSHENKEKEKEYLKLLYEKRIDGLLLATVLDDSPWFNTYINNGVPIVFFDNMPNLQQSFNIVLLDNRKASFMAVEHLYKEGHRNIAMICGDQAETTAKERSEGYMSAMAHCGLDPNPALIKYSDYHDEAGYRDRQRDRNGRSGLCHCSFCRSGRL